MQVTDVDATDRLVFMAGDEVRHIPVYAVPRQRRLEGIAEAMKDLAAATMPMSAL
tara:strand:- start:4954 stop:5118 length:165 start_codon:yes stop_codon:yes gene_type:complete